MAERAPVARGGAAPVRDGRAPVLQLSNISKTFGAVQALQHVDFEVYPAEVVALVGDNGAGKSTLVKTIAGVNIPDSGEILVDGQRVHFTGPSDATHAGIETVYQDLALCDNLDVVSNLFLGREEKHITLPAVGGVLSEADMEQQTRDVLKQLDVKIPSVRSLVASLSGGQRQSIAVAKTILRNAKVVQLDEPTAALGVAQTRQVLNLIRRLREKGLGVILISHNLADVMAVADRAVVMRLGQRVATFDIKTANQNEIVAAITGIEAKDTEPEGEAAQDE